VRETVVLPISLVELILDQARATPEVEVCGLIAAANGQPVRVIPVRNVSPQPRRLFAMDPAGQIAAHRSMRERAETLFGIYHSHPDGPAEPSVIDLEQAAYPEALYLIVSLRHRDAPELRGFRLRHGRASEVRLES
jgi:proteasome lid subunit RPN8/RPN11